MNFIMLDTEGNPITYNIGYVISDDNGNIIVSRSFIISDTLETLTPYQSARAETIQGEKVSFSQVIDTLKNDMNCYSVTSIWAYNAKHDKKILTQTAQYLSYTLPPLQWNDVLTSVNASIAKTRRFNKFIAKRSGKATLENVYCYLFSHTYIEKHQGLSDAIDALKILLHLRNKRKVRIYPKH